MSHAPLDAPTGMMDEGRIKAQAEAYLGSRSGSLKDRMRVWNDYNSLLAKEDTVQHTATLSHELYGRQVEDHKAMSDDWLGKAARAAKPQERVTDLEWAFYYSHALPEIRPQVQTAIKKLASALPPKQQAELRRSMKQWDYAE